LIDSRSFNAQRIYTYIYCNLKLRIFSNLHNFPGIICNWPLKGIVMANKDENVRIREFIELDKKSIPSDGGPRFNRLIFAKSPYLLQHADNPVDWYPWGDEAFEKARRENKPILLSIGYATCHWCHVMAHESFADPEVAEVLNRHLVTIKVDREERPDIDAQYMTAAQMMTGRGGWPLNVIMTPDLKPFYAATYLPGRAKHGMPGLIEIVEKISELWKTRGDMVRKDCDTIVGNLRKLATPPAGALTGGDLSDSAYRELCGMYDPIFGGFGDAPKFPMPLTISFLVRYRQKTGSQAAREMVEKSLRRMRDGGIWDQIGSGIHRYAVDREWIIPHFEKMLYDQAMLAIACLDAYQAFDDPGRLEMAEEIFDYVLRDMTSPEGGFYSGQDADSEGEEGTFYLWTPRQIEDVLGVETGKIFCRAYDVTERGNFEGSSILHRKHPLELLAEAVGMECKRLAAILEEAREKLFLKRLERIRPFRDEKVLTGWNGLMIAALARGAGVTGNERYLSAAAGAAAFIEEHLRDNSGRLFRSFHLGEPSIPAFLEDHSFYAWGLIELYQATADPSHLETARRVTGQMLKLFGDKSGGGFFDAGSDAEEVLVRMKRAYDDVTPSGNSVAAMNLLRLGKITSDESLSSEGERTLRTFMGGAAGQPSGFLRLLDAQDFLLGQGVDITLVFRETGEELRRMIRSVYSKYIPNLTMRFIQEGDDVNGRIAVDGKTTAYVCAGSACRPPAAGPEALEKVLNEAL
jgi:uncharacterized protein YyaL (SSP411 family)